MTTSIETYLHDHLARAAFAVDLLGALCRKHEKDALSNKLSPLLVEIEKDRDELVHLAEVLGIKPGGLKESVARLMEKFSRPKLVNDSNDVFSSFEACETLALGILGKKALWDALSAAIEIPSAQIDFEKLISRAEQQHKIIEGVRLDLAVLSLRRTE